MQQHTPIKIGLMAPLTGLVALYGSEISRAGKIAEDEINENGGILGRPLELIIEDDGSQPETAVPAAEGLIRRDKCIAIIGNLLSNSRIAVANRVSVPLQTPYLNFSFYEGSISNPFFFNFAALPNQQIDKMIPFMVEKYGPKMFFAGSNYEWPRGSIDAAKRILQMTGGEVVGEEYLPIGSENIDELLEDVTFSGADVFVPYFAGTDQVKLLSKFSKLGLKERMAVVMGHYDEVMVSNLSPEVREGLYSSNTYFMNIDTEENLQFLRRLKNYPGVSDVWPDGNGILTNFGEGAYLCIKAFAKAAKTAGTLELAALLKALGHVELNSPQGKVIMDPKLQHANVNSYLAQCQANGTFHIIRRFGNIEPIMPERYRHLRYYENGQSDDTDSGILPDLNRNKWSIGTIIIDSQLQLQCVSCSTIQLCGYEDEKDLLGKPFIDIFKAEPLLTKVTEQIKQSQLPVFFECENRKTDRMMNFTMEKIESLDLDKGYLINLYSPDALEHHPLVKAHPDHFQYAKEVLEVGDIAIIATQSNGEIAYVNRRTCELFGYKAAELIGRDLNMLLPPRFRERHIKMMKKFIESSEVDRRMNQRGEIAGYKKDGAEFPAQARISKIKTNNETLLVASLRDISEQKNMEQILAWKASHDPLTKLPNRILMNERLSNALSRSVRSKKEVAVLFIDLDGFKLINDTYGHEIGDHVLKIVANRLISAIRPGDTVARFGGDEFIIICEQIEDLKNAYLIAERIIESLREPLEIKYKTHYITGSIGIAFGTGLTVDGNELLRNADAAMYEAKEKGRDNWHIFSQELETEIKRELEIANGLRSAIDKNQLECRFQPIVDTQQHKIVGIELLTRWSLHDEYISPDLFIHIAEKIGIIVKLGYWTFQKGCEMEVMIRKLNLNSTVYVSINLSSRQLNEPALIERFQNILDKTGALAQNIMIEITETALMTNVRENLQCLEKLKSMKFHIAVDDFGTGYSSLSNLSTMPITKLKIDKSFIDLLPESKENTTIVSAIINMSKAMKVSVIAEGTENLQQIKALQKLGCRLVQGYYYSRPLSSNDCLEFLQKPL